MHVGHNCDIGEDVILVALTGISGSCTVGNGAVIAGQVGHWRPCARWAGRDSGRAGGGVERQDGDQRRALKPGTVLWGTPARPLKQVLREQAVLARLAKRHKDRD